MQTVISFKQNSWNAEFSEIEQGEALAALESGKMLLLPKLGFTLEEGEKKLLSSKYLVSKAKHISYDRKRGQLNGFDGSEADFDAMGHLMQRFSNSSKELVKSILPQYVSFLTMGRSSFRPTDAATERHISYRKDDRLLHVDAFPASPMCGQRILRVFTNLNPTEPVAWSVGGSFESVAKQFIPQVSRPLRGKHTLMRALQITKKKRSIYDHYMVKIHNAMKKDVHYQKNGVAEQLALPAQSSWIVFSDELPYAITAGQFILEQTFCVPVNAMKNQGKAPLRILESKLGRKLA